MGSASLLPLEDRACRPLFGGRLKPRRSIARVQGTGAISSEILPAGWIPGTGPARPAAGWRERSSVCSACTARNIGAVCESSLASLKAGDPRHDALPCLLREVGNALVGPGRPQKALGLAEEIGTRHLVKRTPSLAVAGFGPWRSDHELHPRTSPCRPIIQDTKSGGLRKTCTGMAKLSSRSRDDRILLLGKHEPWSLAYTFCGRD